MPNLRKFMDPEATSPDSAHDTSGGLHFCALCDKPFIKGMLACELAHMHHINSLQKPHIIDTCHIVVVLRAVLEVVPGHAELVP